MRVQVTVEVPSETEWEAFYSYALASGCFMRENPRAKKWTDAEKKDVVRAVVLHMIQSNGIQQRNPYR